MSVIRTDVPTGGSSGDRFLLHVRSIGSFFETPPGLSCDGFTLVGQVGRFPLWHTWLTRDWDGGEPTQFVVEGVEYFAQSQAMLWSGTDPTVPFALGSDVSTMDAFDVLPVLAVDAVTTTVDASVIVVAFSSMNTNPGPGPTITPTEDALLAEQNAQNGVVWSFDAATAGAYGPWDIDRDGEETFQAGGVVVATIVVQPPTSDPAPVLVDITLGEGVEDGDTPPSYFEQTITNVHPPYQEMTIGAASQAELDAAVAAQYAVWEAEWQADQDADTGDFLDFVVDDLAHNVDWLEANPTWDAQTRTLTQQMTRIQQFLLDEFGPP